MNGDRGFTLVELLVAVALFALLTTAAVAVLGAGTRAAAKAKRYNTMTSCGQAALQTIAGDIRHAIIFDNSPLVSLDAEHEGRHADTIDFIATIPPRYTEDGLPTAARCEIGYSIENDPDTEYDWLLRREDGTLDDDPLEGGFMTQAGPYVSELNFEFYDGIEWRVGWDDEKSLPRAVYIKLAIVDEDGIENPLVLSTTVQIMAQQTPG